MQMVGQWAMVFVQGLHLIRIHENTPKAKRNSGHVNIVSALKFIKIITVKDKLGKFMFKKIAALAIRIITITALKLMHKTDPLLLRARRKMGPHDGLARLGCWLFVGQHFGLEYAFPLTLLYLV